MRELRKEAGRAAKADMDAARERLRKKEAVLRRMRADRAAEEETLRRMMCASSGRHAPHREAAAATASATATAGEYTHTEEESRRKFTPCDVCVDLRERAASHRGAHAAAAAASGLCSRCHARAIRAASAEVRRARPKSASGVSGLGGGGDDGSGGGVSPRTFGGGTAVGFEAGTGARVRSSSSGDGDRLPFEPASTTARGLDALAAALRDAEVCMALAGESRERVAALHKASQLRLAFEACPPSRRMHHKQSMYGWRSGGRGTAGCGSGGAEGGAVAAAAAEGDSPVAPVRTSAVARRRVQAVAAAAAAAARPSTAPGRFILSVPLPPRLEKPERLSRHAKYVGIDRPKLKRRMLDEDPLMHVSP